MSYAIREKYIDEDHSEIRFREFNDIDGDVQEIMRRGWFNYLGALQDRANRAILKKDKRGRIYRIKIKGGYRRHRSSASPQSHANLHGVLRKSLSWKIKGHDRASFGYGVSTTALKKAPIYASWVEGGTRRMRPRPSLHNAVNREEVEPHWDRAFDLYF
jgi:hypothetical protein